MIPNAANLYTFQNTAKSKHLTLKKSQVSLVTYDTNERTTNLHTLGTVKCLAESDKTFAADEFFVVNSKAINLIGGNLALKLNLLILNINNLVINNHEEDLIQNKREAKDKRIDQQYVTEDSKNVI